MFIIGYNISRIGSNGTINEFVIVRVIFYQFKAIICINKLNILIVYQILNNILSYLRSSFFCYLLFIFLKNAIRKMSEIEEFNERIPLAMACNDMGRVVINREINFTNKMDDVSIFYGIENYFSFAPYENCELGQVLLDGLDITKTVKENQLKAIIREYSHMMVIFVPKGADVNRDGSVDISDVVALVNVILGQ